MDEKVEIKSDSGSTGTIARWLKTWHVDAMKERCDAKNFAMSAGDQLASDPSHLELIKLPWLPLLVPKGFLGEFFKTHGLEIKGSWKNSVDLILDMDTGAMISGGYLMNDPKMGYRYQQLDETTLADVDAISLRRILNGDNGKEDASILDGILKEISKQEDCDIQRMRVITQKSLELIASNIQERNEKHEGITLDLLLRSMKNLTIAWRKGKVIFHPAPGKLDVFLGKVALLLEDIDLSAFQVFIEELLPGKPMVLAFAGMHAILPFKIDRSRNRVHISPLQIKIEESFPSGLHGARELIFRIKQDQGVTHVLLLRNRPLIDILLNIIDVLASNSFESQGFDFLGVIVEMLANFLKNFEESWFMVPRPPVVRVFPRIFARVSGLRLDLPKIRPREIARYVSIGLSEWMENAPGFLLCISNPSEKTINSWLLKIKDGMLKDIIPVDISNLIDNSVDLGNAAAISRHPSFLKTMEYLAALNDPTKEEIATLGAKDEGIANTAKETGSVETNSMETFQGRIPAIILTTKPLKVLGGTFKQLFFSRRLRPLRIVKIIRTIRDPKQCTLIALPSNLKKILARRPLKAIKAIQEKIIHKY
ncbi:hypothetical protein GF325_19250 [Candidatus Bathyarchaeota archaeon]|nr:hypothetical protein [Candidatus Bathyarchaeota archaeon]